MNQQTSLFLQCIGAGALRCFAEIEVYFGSKTLRATVLVGLTCKVVFTLAVPLPTTFTDEEEVACVEASPAEPPIVLGTLWLGSL